MFGEKMFREKYSCSVIRTSKKNSWEPKVQRFYFLDETVHQQLVPIYQSYFNPFGTDILLTEKPRG